MQKNEFLTLDGSEGIISDFSEETRGLPHGTPLFISDSRGKICYARNFSFKDDGFNNVIPMISERERSFYLQSKGLCDCMMLSAADGYGDFLVLAKNRRGFCGGVICSYSDGDCGGLDEYIGKLGSFKDFIDSFSAVSVCDFVSLTPRKELETRISGAFHLAKLSNYGRFDFEARYAVPLAVLVQKASDVVGMCGNGMKASLCKECFTEGASVVIPAVFAELLVLSMGLVLRFSKNKTVYVSVAQMPRERSCVRLEAECADSEDFAGVFEESVLKIFEKLNINVSVAGKNGRYVMEMVLENAKVRDITFAETDFVLEQISIVLSQPILGNMFYAIAN